jgi:hypothetical protein
MKKKHAPEQYEAKPKTVIVQSGTTLSVHPAVSIARCLVSWLERGGVPPSIILMHGLNFARSLEYDGLPVDTYRPQLTMQGSDSKIISEVLDALALPHAVKTRVIAEWLQSVWVKKPADTSLDFSFNTVRKAAILSVDRLQPQGKTEVLP